MYIYIHIQIYIYIYICYLLMSVKCKVHRHFRTSNSISRIFLCSVEIMNMGITYIAARNGSVYLCCVIADSKQEQ